MKLMKKGKLGGSISADGEEVDIMPTVELVECERAAYLKGMEDYLQKLRVMAYAEALMKAKKNLESCQIIQEDGEFTERYIHSRMQAKQKE